jgi:DNA-binding HxlR family transcriptional regulator/DNA-binding NarL/FixJ family response regulator
LKFGFESPDSEPLAYMIKSSPRLKTVPVVVLIADGADAETACEYDGNAHVSIPTSPKPMPNSSGRSESSGSNGCVTRQNLYSWTNTIMAMTEYSSSDEPDIPDYLLESVSLLSKKWHPAVIHCLSNSDGLGFSDLEQQLDGISAKVLNDALAELQEYQIIERREINQSPLRVNYTLTERGKELDTVIGSLADWGETYLTEPETQRIVLVADDNEQILRMHTTWLEDEYTVRTARDGEETVQGLDTDVGVVVLDRRMPGLSGGEVLDWIRSQRYDIRVVMVTSELPDPDIFDMAFDEYLTKPVLEDELKDVVADLFERREYSTQLQEYLSLRSKQALVEAANATESLKTTEEYEQLQDRMAALEVNSDDIADADSEILEQLPLTVHQ